MQAFIDRFFDGVNDALGDPHLARRISKSKMLEYLHAAQTDIWEMLLRASGQESMLGRATAAIALVADQEYYPLPGNFRQLVQFIKNDTQEQMISKPYYALGSGLEIIDSSRGFRLDPTPTIAEDWTMTYCKGPIILHHGRAKNIAGHAIRLDTPGVDAGELVTIPDYYKGSMISIYSATTGSPQSREVTAFDAVSLTCSIRHPWSPLPTGKILYEFLPAVPYGFDDVYAWRVAAGIAPRRNQGRRSTMIDKELRRKMDSCRSYFQSTVADRPPERVHHRIFDDDSIYADLEYVV